MKQLFIVGNSTYGTVANLLAGNLAKGAILFTDLVTDGTSGKHTALTAKPNGNFAVYLGQEDAAGNKLVPLCVPEVDINTLQAVKASYSAGNAYSCMFTIPSSIAANSTRNQNLTVMIVKNGTVFNERSTWHFTKVLGKGEAVAASSAKYTATQIAAWFVDQINAAGENLGLTASNSGAVITLTGPDNDTNYTVTFIDDLSITALIADSNSTLASGEFIAAVPAVGDAKYVQRLYQECIEDRGVKYLEGDGKEIYPGYPEAISGTFDVFTLRFKVGRDASKTRDERVAQILHIAIPSSSGYNTIRTYIEYITGISAPAASSGSGTGQ